MPSAIIVRGRLTGPRSVELDEPVAGLQSEVEVILRPRVEPVPANDLGGFVGSLPAGTRNREDIDQQLQDERSGWEGR